MFRTCRGDEQIDVEPGYWRISNKSDIIEECINMQPACLGGTGANSREFCYEGMLGKFN